MNKIFINKPGNTTFVMVAVNTGAFNEINRYKGISHFVEHMCFKGNQKRNQLQISSAIDNIGGMLNAFTDWEITAYWALVGNQHKDLAIEVISDLATDPIFPKDEIDKEREVIIQELKMYEDDPGSAVWELFDSQLYSKESGFHLPIIGTKKTLYNIDKNTLINYHKEKYNNPTLIVVGDIKNYTNINYPNYDYIPSLLESKPKDLLVNRKNITQANIVMGNSIDLTNNIDKINQMFCLLLLNALYNDMSGRLFKTIREKHNLVYRVGFDWDIYKNGFLKWTVFAGLNADKIEIARKLIVEELSRPVTEKDIDIILDKAIGKREITLDSNINVGRLIGYSLCRGIDYSAYMDEYANRLENATEHINEFIKKMNFSNNVLVAIIPENE
jgi:predicted Zn-dependent peptidase